MLKNIKYIFESNLVIKDTIQLVLDFFIYDLKEIVKKLLGK